MDADNLPQVLFETASQHAMFPPDAAVVVGVSGGQDSATLLHALAGLRSVWNLRIVAAHLNHGFRGAEADADASYVAELAGSLQIPCSIERIDVPALKKRRHLSSQEAAREARHAFLRKIAAQENAARIALGHTQDDRIESILLNLLRGTGPDGLQGFPPVALPIVRPLYNVRRSETEAYCIRHDLKPRRDASNEKTDYRRNRIRLELLPHLASYYNSDVGAALLRMSELVSADNALLDELAEAALCRCILSQTDNALLLDCPALNEQPLAVRRRILRKAIALVRGTLQNVDFAAIEDILRHSEHQTNFSVTLPHNDADEIRIIVHDLRVSIDKHYPPATQIAWITILAAPTETSAAICGGSAVLRKFSNGLAAAQWVAENYTPEQKSDAERRAVLMAFKETDLQFPLALRSWQSGDRMRPSGMDGTKKLQDLFTDAKISGAARFQIPVLAGAGGSGEILAVIGLRAGGRVIHDYAAFEGAVRLFEWCAAP